MQHTSRTSLDPRAHTTLAFTSDPRHHQRTGARGAAQSNTAEAGAAGGALCPPRGEVSAEVSFSPGGERDNVLLDVDVREREGQRRRATDDLALGVVLGTVAGALELVLGRDPGNDAAKMGADGVQAEALDLAVGVHDEVRGVTLQAWDSCSAVRG